MANVQAGDMAIVVRTMPAQKWALGRIVEVGHRCMRCDFARDLLVWRLAQAIHGPRGQYLGCCEDYCLKRIPPLSTMVEWESLMDLEVLA